MKIDLHCHTKMCKKGDGDGRNVTPALFKEKIESNGIEIVAITNHNDFDVKQYYDLKNSVTESCDVWPGIEFDVKGSSKKTGHILVICNPSKVEDFNNIIQNLIKDISPDDFIITISELCNSFNSLEVVYIPHYFKDHQLSEEDMQLLEDNVYSSKRLLREPSDIKSLGVLNANGYRSIIGSDVKDWNDYDNCSFADLKYKIKGFDNFLKLLDKDSTFLNDLINRDLYETVTVYGKSREKKHPFEIDVYNDINVIFGDKGSGKSEILDSLHVYFKNEKGIDAVKYSGGDKTSWFEGLIKENPTSYSHENLDVGDLIDEITNVREYSDKPPKKIDQYLLYFNNISTNKKRQKLLILNQNKVLTFDLTQYQDYYSEYKKVAKFEDELYSFESFKMNKQKYEVLVNSIKELKNDAYKLSLAEWCKQWADFLTDNLIDKLDEYSSESDGTPQIPKETGFYDFCNNRFKLIDSIKLIKKTLMTKEKTIEYNYIGKIGDKGAGYLNSQVGFLTLDNYSEISANQVTGKKTTIKTYLNVLNLFENKCYSSELVTLITEMNNDLNDTIESIDYFIYNKKQFELNNESYMPSKGEMAILSLQYNLLNKTNEEVFLIDEPEVNLGSTYIENTIVPLIKNLGRAKKKVIIATHDANIAIRTYPVTSILKKSSNNTYETYQGSMFTNELIDKKSGVILKWDEESEKYLEGGKIAFEERGTLYGTTNRSNN